MRGRLWATHPRDLFLLACVDLLSKVQPNTCAYDSHICRWPAVADSCSSPEAMSAEAVGWAEGQCLSMWWLAAQNLEHLAKLKMTTPQLISEASWSYSCVEVRALSAAAPHLPQV